MKEKWDSDKKSSDAIQSLVSEAGLGLAKKDEKIHNLEKEIKSLNCKIRDMIAEKDQTIEAHQNRIKQLQDHFLVQITEAGKLEVFPEKTKLQGRKST
jgi:hypothetical protein